MSDDLVTRLRGAAEGFDEVEMYVSAQRNREAADRIERLEAEVRYLNASSLSLVRQFNEYKKEAEKLREALWKISQHDLQAIARDALRPGQRAPLEGGND